MKHEANRENLERIGVRFQENGEWDFRRMGQEFGDEVTEKLFVASFAPAKDFPGFNSERFEEEEENLELGIQSELSAVALMVPEGAGEIERLSVDLTLLVANFMGMFRNWIVWKQSSDTLVRAYLRVEFCRKWRHLHRQLSSSDENSPWAYGPLAQAFHPLKNLARSANRNRPVVGNRSYLSFSEAALTVASAHHLSGAAAVHSWARSIHPEAYHFALMDLEDSHISWFERVLEVHPEWDFRKPVVASVPPKVEAPKRSRMSKEEAEAKAGPLKARLIAIGKNKTKWAKVIGCGKAMVGQLQAWKDAQLTWRARSNGGRLRATSTDPTVLDQANAAKESSETLEEIIEQQRRDERSRRC